MSLFLSSWVTCSWFVISCILTSWRWWWTRFTHSRRDGLEMYREGSSHLLCTMAERRESAVKIHWSFTKESAAFVELCSMTFNGLFGNRLTMPEAVVHAWLLCRFSSGLICTSPLVSVATNTILSDPAGIFGRFGMCSRRGASLLWLFHLVSYVCVLLACPWRQESVPPWNYWKLSRILAGKCRSQTCYWMRSVRGLIPPSYVQYVKLLSLWSPPFWRVR